MSSLQAYQNGNEYGNHAEQDMTLCLQGGRRVAYQVDAPVEMQTNAKSWITLRRLRKPEFHIYLKTLNVMKKSQRVVIEE